MPEERELQAGAVRHSGGDLILCGAYAGLVLGRAEVVIKPTTLGAITVMRQYLEIDGKACERIFTIDTIEPQLAFSQSTPVADEAAAWFDRESIVLGRYNETLSEDLPK